MTNTAPPTKRKPPPTATATKLLHAAHTAHTMDRHRQLYDTRDGAPAHGTKRAKTSHGRTAPHSQLRWSMSDPPTKALCDTIVDTALLFRFVPHLVRTNDPPMLTASPETNPARALHFGLWLANYPLEKSKPLATPYQALHDSPHPPASASTIKAIHDTYKDILLFPCDNDIQKLIRSDPSE